jgi:hypothetical protein
MTNAAQPTANDINSPRDEQDRAVWRESRAASSIADAVRERLNMTRNMTPSTADIDRMLADQDFAAREFWAYPPQEWQADFQEQWLLERGFSGTVVVEGVTYGATA